MSESFDLIVLGAGSGGLSSSPAYSAARQRSSKRRLAGGGVFSDNAVARPLSADYAATQGLCGDAGSGVRAPAAPAGDDGDGGFVGVADYGDLPALLLGAHIIAPFFA